RRVLFRSQRAEPQGNYLSVRFVYEKVPGLMCVHVHVHVRNTCARDLIYTCARMIKNKVYRRTGRTGIVLARQALRTSTFIFKNQTGYGRRGKHGIMRGAAERRVGDGRGRVVGEATARTLG